LIRRLTPWIPAALWAGVLFFLSSRSWGDAPSRIPVDDSVVHFGLYFVFGVLLALGRRLAVEPPSFFRVFIIGLLYALSDEVHQLFVPGRTFDPMDLLADGLGVLIGLGTVHRWTRPDVPRDRRGRSATDDASSRATA
jgi:VanZ family protein